jgi:tRNA(fMet)-specific endonuclease VapC
LTSTKGDVLLDTNVIVEHFRTANPNLLGHLQSGRMLYMPLIVLGELFTGAYRGTRQTNTLRQIQSFLAMTVIIRPDETTADHYGQIQAVLSKAGTPIPQNDTWIAALAREHQMPVATRDAHFNQVPGVTVLNW